MRVLMTRYLFHIADDGSLRHLPNGLDVANGQGRLLSGIDRLHRARMFQVDACSRDACSAVDS